MSASLCLQFVLPIDTVACNCILEASGPQSFICKTHLSTGGNTEELSLASPHLNLQHMPSDACRMSFLCGVCMYLRIIYNQPCPSGSFMP